MIEELKKSDFFVGLDEKALAAVAGFTKHVTFEANETVYERDADAPSSTRSSRAASARASR